MLIADGCLLVICRGRITEKGKATFSNGEGGEDVSWRLVITFMGGRRTLYFDSEKDLNACPVQVGQRVDAVGEASEGKGGKIYMRNVTWLKAGQLSDSLDDLFVRLNPAAGEAPPAGLPPAGLPPRTRAAA